MSRRKEPQSQIPTFTFRPELFEHRAHAIEKLAVAGFVWLRDYSAVDLMHRENGLEVCGVRSIENVRPILRILRQLFPTWRFKTCWYKAEGVDPGWCIAVHEFPEQYQNEY